MTALMTEEIIAEAAALARLIGPSFVAPPELVRQRIASLPADVQERAVRDAYWSLAELRIPRLLLHPDDLRTHQPLPKPPAPPRTTATPA